MMRKKPMLAYPVSDKPIDYNDTVFMQPKLDGVRCLIQYERRVQPREDVVVAYNKRIQKPTTPRETKKNLSVGALYIPDTTERSMKVVQNREWRPLSFEILQGATGFSSKRLQLP